MFKKKKRCEKKTHEHVQHVNMQTVIVELTGTAKNQLQQNVKLRGGQLNNELKLGFIYLFIIYLYYKNL